MEAGIVKWPLSVLRIRSKDTSRLIDLAEHVSKLHGDLIRMKMHLFMLKQTVNRTTRSHRSPENDGDTYELDLTLRNNITTDEHPLGVYHPHAQLSSY